MSEHKSERTTQTATCWAGPWDGLTLTVAEGMTVVDAPYHFGNYVLRARVEVQGGPILYAWMWQPKARR